MKNREVFLLARILLPNDVGCMIWTGRKNQPGYGEIKGPGGTYLGVAHRAAYEYFVGPIPAGLVLDHLCRVRTCCHPDHLEPVTPAENTKRGFGATAQHGRKTSCLRGHPFTQANTYINPAGSRVCRECKRARTERYRVAGRVS